ncbi:hypothetical protein E4U21_003988 [Claviceps maximensis]|nr:hypothetical protein E4U21_003988 [Claviceps maximensis]
MHDNMTTLFPNEKVAIRVSEYADSHSVPLSKALVEYHEWVMTILEIGSFVGFSVAAWSEAVGTDGSVTGLERSPETAQLSRDRLAASGFENTEIIVGDALESISKLEPQEPYDIIFIDALKTEYPDYLRAILKKSQPGQKNRLLRAGGLVIADNALRAALVADASEDNPAIHTVPKETANWVWGAIECLDEFNTLMNEHPRLESVLLPVMDGICLGRVLD